MKRTFMAWAALLLALALSACTPLETEGLIMGKSHAKERVFNSTEERWVEEVVYRLRVKDESQEGKTVEVKVDERLYNRCAEGQFLFVVDRNYSCGDEIPPKEEREE